MIEKEDIEHLREDMLELVKDGAIDRGEWLSDLLSEVVRKTDIFDYRDDDDVQFLRSEQASQDVYDIRKGYYTRRFCTLRGRQVSFRSTIGQSIIHTLGNVVADLLPKTSIQLSGSEYDPVRDDESLYLSVSETMNLDFLEEEIKEVVEEMTDEMVKELGKLDRTDINIIKRDCVRAEFSDDFTESKLYVETKHPNGGEKVSIDEPEKLLEYIIQGMEASREADKVDEIEDGVVDEMSDKYKQKFHENEELIRRREKLRDKLIDEYNEQRDEKIISRLEEKGAQNMKEERQEFVAELISSEVRKPRFDETDAECLKPTINEEENKVGVVGLAEGNEGLEMRRGYPDSRGPNWDKISPYSFVKNAQDFNKDSGLVRKQIDFESESVLIQTGIRQYFFGDPRKWLDRTFLVKRVDGKVTCTQVPNTIDTVEEAIEYTKRYEVKQAEANGRDVIEYADYWFVEMKQRQLSEEDFENTDYEYKVENGRTMVVHPYHGAIEFDNKYYKPYPKKSAERKNDIVLNRFELDVDKYKEKYVNVPEEKRDIIEERTEELIEFVDDVRHRRNELLEPSTTRSGDRVRFPEPRNYTTGSTIEMQWLDRMDATDEHLLVVAGFKAYWLGTIWGSQARQFLLGKEDGQAWYHQVPLTVDGVEEALDYMKPAKVKKAEENGLDVDRQGDIFFIERARTSNMSELEDTEHEAERVDDKWVIKHPEHAPIILEGEWEAVQNNTASRPGNRGRQLAD